MDYKDRSRMGGGGYVINPKIKINVIKGAEMVWCPSASPPQHPSISFQLPQRSTKGCPKASCTEPCHLRLASLVSPQKHLNICSSRKSRPCHRCRSMPAISSNYKKNIVWVSQEIDGCCVFEISQFNLENSRCVPSGPTCRLDGLPPIVVQTPWPELRKIVASQT